MATCYLDKKYECQYEVTDSGIEVCVDYDIEDEIPAINGVKSYGSNTRFKPRDILIIDSQKKANYMVKDAHYNGHRSIYGTPDGGTSTNFFSRYYLYDKDYEKLCSISDEKNIKKIKIYSNLINEFIGYPSLSIMQNDEDYNLNLKRKNAIEIVNVQRNNIETIAIGDVWNSKQSNKLHEIEIKFDGYIEIELKESIDYCEVQDYIKELAIYFQIIKPNNFSINKILLEIDGEYYGINNQVELPKIKEGYIDNSVDETLVDFLSKCYEFIPYRNS